MDLKKAKNYKKLSAKQKAVICDQETETPFTGELLYNKKSGEYNCAACESKIFKSENKFDSGSGWLSFDKAISESVKIKKSQSNGMIRDEVSCSNCGAHLGHMFDDGPEETTGIRYCINSISLNFIPNKTKK